MSQWCHLTISSCRPHLLLPSIFPSIRVFSNESVLRIRWPKYWSFSFSISPSKEYSGLISFWMDWLYLLVVQGTLKNLLQHRSSKASILRHSSFLYSPTFTSMESQRVGHNLATNTFTFYLVHGSLMVHNGLVSLVLPPLTDEAEGKRGWVTAIGCAACKRWGSRVSPICSKNLVLIWLAARTFSSLCRSKQTIFPDPDQTLPSLSWDFFFFLTEIVHIGLFRAGHWNCPHCNSWNGYFEQLSKCQEAADTEGRFTQ